jgi:hypothetical protein
MRAVHCRVTHVQQTGRPQLRRKDLAQTGPDTGLGPVPQPPPSGHPAAAGPLRRHIRPAHALAQHVDDAPQSSTVIHRQPPGIPIPPRRTRRQQRSYAFPQVIRYKISRHPEVPADTTLNCQASTPISFRNDQLIPLPGWLTAQRFPAGCGVSARGRRGGPGPAFPRHAGSSTRTTRPPTAGARAVTVPWWPRTMERTIARPRP